MRPNWLDDPTRFTDFELYTWYLSIIAGDADDPTWLAWLEEQPGDAILLADMEAEFGAAPYPHELSLSQQQRAALIALYWTTRQT